MQISRKPEKYKLSKNNKLDPYRNALYAAAVEAGLTAWRAGQDIETALTAAGYAKYVVDGVISYISSSSTSQEPTVSTSSSMSPQTKRGRYTVPVAAAKKKVPVAPSVKKYVKACMDKIVETKYTNISVASTNIPTAGTVNGSILCGITQGLTDGQRTGNHIRVREINLLGTFADSTENIARVILFWDRQPNGAAPAFGELIAAADVNGVYNHDTVSGSGGSRISILRDQRVYVQPTITATGARRNIKYSIKCNVPVTYDGSGGTVTDMVTNNLCIAFISLSATIDFSGYIDVAYTDA